MAVAHFRLEAPDGTEQVVALRQFAPPARSCELKYWYRAVRKVLPAMPPWEDRFANGALIDLHAIIMDGVMSDQSCWYLTISRKKYLN